MMADLSDQVTIDEAFQILWPFAKPYEAKVLLSSAIVVDKVDFCADGKKVPPDWFESYFEIRVNEHAKGRWTAELRMIRAVENFHTTKWTVSRPHVMALYEETRQPTHPGGRPRIYDHDDIRAAAFIALLKKGTVSLTLPESYSGNDLAADVEAILGGKSPKEAQLGKILDPLFQPIKSRLNAGS
jgi:hypothetical protein